VFARRWKFGTIFTAALALVSAACNSGSTANVQNPPPPVTQTISIAFQSAPPSSILVAATASISAVVTNDTTNGGMGSGVDWSITCASSNCGTFSGSNTASGTTIHTASGQAVTYIAPSTMTGNSEVVNIAGFATADHTKNVLASLTVTALGNNLIGTYILELQGVWNGSPFQMVGAVALDGNGNITGGSLGLNYSGSNGFTAENPAGGNYFLGPDGRGTMTIPNSLSSTLSGSFQTFSLSYLSTDHLLIAASIPNSSSWSVTASGTMDLQSSSALTPLSGGYAFVMSGTDFTVASPVGLGGVFNVDNIPNSTNNISGAGSIADEYGFSNVVGNWALTSRMGLTGNVSTVGQYGQFTVSLNLNSSAISTTTLTITGFVVDGTTIKLIESDQNGQGSVAGVAIAQGASTGTYTSPASFTGTYVLGLLGVDYASGQPDTFTAASVIGANGAGSLQTGYADVAFQTLASLITGNQGTQISGTFSGSYASGLDGRYEAYLARFASPYSLFYPQFIFYLGTPNSPAVVLASASSTTTPAFPFVAVGIAYPQSQNPLNFSGSYGLYFSQQNGTEYDGTGVMNVASSSITGTMDVGPSIDQAFTGTSSSTSCSSAVSGCFPASFANATGSSAFVGTNLNIPGISFTTDIYMIDSTQGFFVENDVPQQSSPQVSLGYFSAATAPQSSAAAKKNRHH
jgi:hypothetical protein